MSLKIDTSVGVSHDAKEFLEGFETAYKAGLAVEYTEMFLDTFQATGSAVEAKEDALAEWDLG